MGLAISVGMLADLVVHDPEGAEWIRDSISRLNEVLAKNGLPAHREPERFEPWPSIDGCTSFPYGFLHYLRRAFAHVRQDLPVPDDEELRPEHERVVDDVGSDFGSHLLCHSDAEGFYVPIDFAEPIFDDAVPGTMLGSSQRLRRELLEVAPHLGIELDGERPTAASKAELVGIEDGGRLWRERLVWNTLFEAARLSIEHGSLIVFH